MYAAKYSEKPSAIKALAKVGADINARNANGMTALMLAVTERKISERKVSGILAIVVALIRAGADVNGRDSVHGMTPIMYVVNRSDTDEVLLQEFLKAQANLSVVCRNTLENVLHLAAARNYDPRVMAALLENSSDKSFEARDSGGNTPLMRACKSNSNPEVLLEMLNHDMNIRVQDKENLNPAILFENNSEARENSPDTYKVILEALQKEIAGADGELEGVPSEDVEASFGGVVIVKTPKKDNLSTLLATASEELKEPPPAPAATLKMAALKGSDAAPSASTPRIQAVSSKQSPESAAQTTSAPPPVAPGKQFVTPQMHTGSAIPPSVAVKQAKANEEKKEVMPEEAGKHTPAVARPNPVPDSPAAVSKRPPVKEEDNDEEDIGRPILKKKFF